MNAVVNYLLFIGSGLYLVSAIMFLYIFIRTLKTKDGVGLIFLKTLSLCLSIGSLTIFVIRILSEYGTLDLLTARAIAVVNPILLVSTALYLNYLFHHPEHILKSINSKNIKQIKKDVTKIKHDVKEVKDEVLK